MRAVLVRSARARRISFMLSSPHVVAPFSHFSLPRPRVFVPPSRSLSADALDLPFVSDAPPVASVQPTTHILRIPGILLPWMARVCFSFH
ncbi:ATG8/AUT7/APG8/PAZ2, putative [Leishmania donovani]|uniref:ATG8/AUT7/APG8/PAZ2, putative n=1 Tax=Leishmania donovani TaxID=5661 RepID=E9BE79_LEIDO|nr:ATG8/AUT7/APG8/PAZ2, putative [Leishmania donovani]CBZ33555.1 ATG8/AUT7/APG8/PAZ2, putative [Leishmania donovani]